MIIENDMFIFFVVSTERWVEREKDSISELTKKTLKKILNLSSHFILESNNKEIGFLGTIAYEVRFNELYGMEFTSSLLQDSSRVVTECRSLRKKSFNNVVDMLDYYEIEYSVQDDPNEEIHR